MKIVHLTWEFDTKMGYQEVHLIREQLKQGHEVVIVAANRSYVTQAIMEGDDKPKPLPVGMRLEEGIMVYRVPTVFFLGRPWLKNIPAVLDELQPDVIHCHAVMQYYALRVARYKKKHPEVMLVYDSHNQTSRVRNTIWDKMGRWVGRKILTSWDCPDTCFVGITDECCWQLVYGYGVPREKVYLLELGSNHRHYRPDDQLRAKMRQQLNLGDEEILLVNTGKIFPNKKIDVLIRSIASLRLRKEIPPVKLLHIGGGSEEHRRTIENEIAKSGVDDIVTLLATVNHLELADYYRAADICVWPGTVTISMIDAAACGTALIVSDSEGVGYQVSNNNGMVCSKDVDEPELTEAIRELVLNREKRLKMGHNGRKLVEDKLSWEKINHRFMRLYRGERANEDVWQENNFDGNMLSGN